MILGLDHESYRDVQIDFPGSPRNPEYKAKGERSLGKAASCVVNILTSMVFFKHYELPGTS